MTLTMLCAMLSHGSRVVCYAIPRLTCCVLCYPMAHVLCAMLSHGSRVVCYAIPWLTCCVLCYPTAHVLCAMLSHGSRVVCYAIPRLTCCVLCYPMAHVFCAMLSHGSRVSHCNCCCLLSPGKPVVGERGELVCTVPFPSMPTHFWSDPDGLKYKKAYFMKFPGVCCVGLM